MKNTDKAPEKKAVTRANEALSRKVLRIVSSVRAGLVIDFPGGARQ